MKRRIFYWALLVTVVVIIVSESLPELAGTARAGGVAAFLTVVIAEAAWAARGLRGREPSQFESMLEYPLAHPGAPGDLERLRRALGHKVYSQAEFEHRVRPELRRLAAPLGYRAGADHSDTLTAPPAGMPPELWSALYGEDPLDRRWKTSDVARLLDLIEERG